MNRTSYWRVASNVLGAFGVDSSGSMTTVFMMSLLVLIPALGGAIDIGNSYRVREQLLGAADAAILAAVATNSASYLGISSHDGDGRFAAAEEAAKDAFKAQLAGQPNVQTNVTATIEKSGWTVTATVAFEAKVKTNFLGMIGLPELTVDGHSSSFNTLPAYINLHLLLDNSPSMGIAATQADMDTMVANTTGNNAGGCAFACHEMDAASLPQGIDNYTIAHNLGVTTRIDVLRRATQDLMDTAAAMAVAPNQYGVAIDTFNTSLQPVSPMSTNLAAAKTNAAAIDLMVVSAQGANNDRDTSFDTVLPQFDATVPTSGSGKSPADPQRVAFIVTDAVADEVASTTPTTVAGASSLVVYPAPATPQDRLIQTINPSLCQSMKDRGIKVAVIYATYLPLPTNSFYTSWVQPWEAEINPNALACASPGLFFEVSPTQDLSATMKSVFQSVVANARLTQ